MIKYGLKLWSKNKNYIKDALKLYESGVFSYIELFAEPDTYEQFINLWKGIKIPFVVHAAHSLKGLNLAKKDHFKNNILLAQEAFKFANDLNAKFVIFHPGLDGNTSETVRQLNWLIEHDVIDVKLTLIENKPYYALFDNLICNGHSPEEIKFIVQEAGVSFCLDVGHVIYSANAKKIDSIEYLKSFNDLNPKMYHFMDGDFNGIYDVHKNIGQGSFGLKRILSFFYSGSYITIETPKNENDNLRDFLRDIKFLNKLIDDE